MKHSWMPIALLAASAVALAAVETLPVESASVTLRVTPDIYGKAIATAPKGATLPVLEKNEKFAKVASEGKEGWIRLSDLKPQKATAKAGAGPTQVAGKADDSAAGKGLGPNAEAYAKAKGGDPKKIDALIERRNKLIDTGELATFAAQGKVGQQGGK